MIVTESGTANFADYVEAARAGQAHGYPSRLWNVNGHDGSCSGSTEVHLASHLSWGRCS